MPDQRGLISPALSISTVALIACAICWGALGVASLDAQTMSDAMHRYLCAMLVMTTTCAVVVNMTARALRSLLSAIEAGAASDAGRYAEGYTDGLDAAPVSRVIRLVPTQR